MTLPPSKENPLPSFEEKPLPASEERPLPPSKGKPFAQPPPLYGAPLVIGVAGPTKLVESSLLADAVTQLLDDLYASRDARFPALAARLGGFVKFLNQRSKAVKKFSRLLEERFFSRGRKPPLVLRWLRAGFKTLCELPPGKIFKHPIGLSQTPLMILTSLAPGTDTKMVELIRTWAQNREHPIPVEVVVTLPFPPDIYREVSSSFVNNQEATKQFEKMLETTRYFTVRNTDERSLDDDRLSEKLRAGCTGDPALVDAARKARYKLASSFVANSCDLLLALATADEITAAAKTPPFRRAEGDEVSTMTSQCIGAKRHGVGTPGMSSTPIFSWADHGPVVVVPILRTPDGARPTGEVPEVRYPAALGTVARGRERGEERFAKMCGELEAFNQACSAAGLEPTAKERSALRDDLKAFCPGFGTLPDGPSKEAFRAAWELEPNAEFNQALAVLAMRRRRVANLERPVSEDIRATQSTLFRFVFCAAVLLHIYGHTPHFHGQWLILVSILALALLAQIIYTVFSHSRTEQHADDWRAIAEGMRVQFFWAAAGLPNSAAANYLERMRSELDWIRNVIGAWSLPYARWRVAFDALQPAEKLERLRVVRRTWLVGQHRYFHTKAKEYTTRKHHAHLKGLWLIYGGIGLLILVLILDLVLPPHDAGHGLLLIALGALLLAGGMVLAKAEKQLLMEHALQYAAMRELMRTASRRLRQLLAEGAAHLASGNEEAANEVIEECQRLYLEIGRQALDENAEWLLLHRARPVEIPAGA